MNRFEIKQHSNMGPCRVIRFQAYCNGKELSEQQHSNREDAMREIFEYQLTTDTTINKARPVLQGIWDQVKNNGVAAPLLDPPVPDDIEPHTVEAIWRHGLKYADIVIEANTGAIVSWTVRIDDRLWSHHDYFDFKFPRLLQRMYK